MKICLNTKLLLKDHTKYRVYANQSEASLSVARLIQFCLGLLAKFFEQTNQYSPLNIIKILH